MHSASGIYQTILQIGFEFRIAKQRGLAPGKRPHRLWQLIGGRQRRVVEQQWNYALSIETAVPETIIPPETGISTFNRLGRPMASPWRISIVAGAAMRPASRR